MGVLLAVSMCAAMGGAEAAVWPWVWDALYFDCVSVVVVEESLRKLFGLLLWGYLHKAVDCIFRNCVYSVNPTPSHLFSKECRCSLNCENVCLCVFGCTQRLAVWQCVLRVNGLLD